MRKAIRDAISYPPALHPSQVPLVKSLALMVHPSAVEAKSLLSEQLRAHVQDNEMSLCVDLIRAFWGSLLPPNGSLGSFWLDLVKTAHMAPGEHGPQDYSQVTAYLRQQLASVFLGEQQS